MIHKIQLTNFKSHKSTNIDFAQKGTFSIFGANYAGKTSVLQAIGFALFNWKQGKNSDFIRKGTKKATVTVDFQSKIDGKVYRSYRDIGKNASSWYIFHEEDIMAKGNEQVTNFLKSHFMLRDNIKLDLLFQEIIGVPQGETTSLLRASSTYKKESFDAFFGFSSYRKTSKSLTSEVMRKLREKKAEEEKIEAGHLGELSGFEGLEARIRECRKSKNKSEKQLQQSKIKTKKQQQIVESFAEKYQELCRLEKESSLLEKELGLLLKEQELKEIESSQLVEKIKEKEVFKESFNTYQQLATRKQVLVKILEEAGVNNDPGESLPSLRKRVMDCQKKHKQLEATKKSLDQLSHSLPNIKKLAAKERELRESIKDIEFQQAYLSQCNQEIEEQKKNIARIDDSKSSEDFLEHVNKLEAEIKDVQVQVEKYSTTRDKTSFQIELLERNIKTQVQNLCPFLGKKCMTAENSQITLKDTFQSQKMRLENELEKAILPAYHSAQKTLASLSSQRNYLLEKRDNEEQKQQEILFLRKLLVEKISQSQSLRTELATSEETIKSYQQVQGNMQEQERIENELQAQESVEQEFLECTQKLHILEKEWKQRELDEAKVYEQRQNLYSLQKELDHHQLAFEHYKESLTAKEKLEHLILDLRSLEKKIEALLQKTLKLSQTKKELQGVNEDYNQAQVNLYQLESEKEKLELNNSHITQTFHTLEEQLTKKNSIERKLSHTQEHISKQEKRLKVLKTVCACLKAAGPEVAYQIRKEVQEKANHIYGSMVDAQNERISIDDDYRISLSRGQQEKPFQLLAGSEQIACSIALRIGLLQQVCDLDFVFFDEPTIHLDEEHRFKLAEQIHQLPMKQRFIISHDDSFEPYLDAAYHVKKVGTVSSLAKTETF